MQGEGEHYGIFFVETIKEGWEKCSYNAEGGGKVLSYKNRL